MLTRIFISNFALIKQTELAVEKGFSAITGDSGSGKSLLLEAVNLALGARANYSAIGPWASKCVVELEFYQLREEVLQALRHHELDVLDRCILRREINTDKRSRVFVNDTPTTLGVLAAIARTLVDVHGQRENLALESPAFQTEQLDEFAQGVEHFEQYELAYQHWLKAKAEREQAEHGVAAARREEDFLRFQLTELQAVKCDSAEFEAMQAELRRFEHAEKLAISTNAAAEALSGDDGALTQLRAAAQQLNGVAGVLPSVDECVSRLRSVIIEVADVANELEREAGAADVDPRRAEQLAAQVDECNRLMHKHGFREFEALLALRQSLEARFGNASSVDDRKDELKAAEAEAYEQALQKGMTLSAVRRAVSVQFAEALQKQVRQLGMPKARVETRLVPANAPSALGLERVEIGFAANGGEPKATIAEVASGGECARLMLALKCCQPSRQNRSLVFDEIDTGVSGEVALKMGDMMKKLAEHTQVLAVTHLPGVASRSNHHLLIQKQLADELPSTSARWLSQTERVEEVARLFSGDKLSAAALESARALMAATD